MNKITKEALRQRSLKFRNGIAPRERKKRSLKILHKLLTLEEFKKAKRVATYLSFGSEVSTLKLPGLCWKLGKTVVVPVTARGLEKTFLSELKAHDRLKKSRWGIPEPSRKNWRPVALKSLNLIVIPGVAFDRLGHRLGYGGGVFDRLLKSAPRAVRVGLAFEPQLVSRLPRGLHDERLDVLLTERRTLRWRRNK